jgi:2-polyprenyl-3-methyl-5-hydroxy-6-metoxy-1,4-benzoquinol methylase
MHLGVISDNPIERLILKLGLAPEPMMTTQMAFTMARAIMAGVDLGLFDAMAEGRATALEIAKACKTDPRATDALLGALVGCGCAAVSGERYSLTSMTRKWLLRSSDKSIANKMVFQKLEWDIMGKLEEYVKTGKALDMHEKADTAMWKVYQAGMADIGKLSVEETVSRTPVPQGATTMLDIGGSGGTYSAGFLKKHAGLQSTILDLPSAVPHAKPFVDSHKLGERLRLTAGNVLTDDLGKDKYDFVFMSNVAHHLSEAQNREVAKKVLGALKPGGVFSIQELIRTKTPSKKSQMGLLLDLYFAMTSHSGTWTTEQMSAWFTGYREVKTVKFRTAPGTAQVWGRK